MSGVKETNPAWAKASAASTLLLFSPYGVKIGFLLVRARLYHIIGVIFVELFRPRNGRYRMAREV